MEKKKLNRKIKFEMKKIVQKNVKRQEKKKLFLSFLNFQIQDLSID